MFCLQALEDLPTWLPQDRKTSSQNSAKVDNLGAIARSSQTRLCCLVPQSWIDWLRDMSKTSQHRRRSTGTRHTRTLGFAYTRFLEFRECSSTSVSAKVPTIGCASGTCLTDIWSWQRVSLLDSFYSLSLCGEFWRWSRNAPPRLFLHVFYSY